MVTLLDDLKRAPFTRLDRGSEGGTPAHKYPTPDLGTAIIPKERYTSVDYMKLEWQRMWTKTWMIGGRHEVIPEPGDWMTHEIGAESLVFVRQPDMSIKGLFQRLSAPRQPYRLEGFKRQRDDLQMWLPPLGMDARRRAFEYPRPRDFPAAQRLFHARP